jgi:CubicO group peptidase (beta-lactamase class C family)
MGTPPKDAHVGIASATDGVFKRAAARDNVRGIAYGVVLDGNLVHSGGVGGLRHGTSPRPGPDSRSRICSMSKSFLAAAVLMLRDAGILALDDPIARYVPAAQDVTLPTADSPPLTVRLLMSMASGLPEDDLWADRNLELAYSDVDKILRRGVVFARPPGTAFEYSNLGYVLLAQAIRGVSGVRAQEFVEVQLLAPLGWLLLAGIHCRA